MSNNCIIREIASSRAASKNIDGNGSAYLIYDVQGDGDPDDLETELLTVLPTSYSGGRIAQLDRNYIGGRDGDGTQTWQFKATYNRKKLEVGESRLSIDGNAGNIRMTTSLGTTIYGTNAPDFLGSIDVDPDNDRPRGVDRIIPAMKLNLHYRLAYPVDPFAFARLAGSLAGTVNNSTLMTHDAGELLFLGFSGEFITDQNPELTFSWASSANATLTIGSIASVAKPGHDYLWVLYEDNEIAAGGDTFFRSTPRAVYVERIYELADHGLLGLLGI